MNVVLSPGSPGYFQAGEGDCAPAWVWGHVHRGTAERRRHPRSLGQTGALHALIPRKLLGQVCQEKGKSRASFSVSLLFVILWLCAVLEWEIE